MANSSRSTHPNASAASARFSGGQTPYQAPVSVSGCPLCEQVGGRPLQNHEAYRVVAIDDHELPGYARVIWNSHVQEVSDLLPAEQALLMQALHETDLFVRRLHKPHKVNIASFGNHVPHLHFHVIPRWRTDPWWPETPWSAKPPLIWHGVAAAGFHETELAIEDEPALITTGDWSRLSPWAKPVRQAVFLEEQRVPSDEEWDNLDAISRHAVIRVGDKAVATGRLAPDGRIGRMAVLKPARGKNLGRSILRALIEESEIRGLLDLKVHAQLQAMGFYEKEGFDAEGSDFTEAGILHRLMTRVR